MSVAVAATAPGKLMLTGEYAVLAGAPAVAMAVDINACARVSPVAGEFNRFDIPEQRAHFPFAVEDGAVRWIESSPGDRGRMIESFFAVARVPEGSAPMAIELDSDAFFRGEGESRVKLGLGSSAAVLVALAGAVRAFVTGELPAPETLAGRCLDAHRRFQGGAGSGADVMTALLGGVLGVMPGATTRPSAIGLDWPDRLLVLPVWSGRSASTTDLLARVDAARRRQPDLVAGHIDQLGQQAAASFAAWRTGRADEVIASAAAYARALAAFDQAAAIGIVTAEHRAVGRICDASGAIYKTSGAGGGDFGLVLTDSRRIAQRTRSALAAEGWEVMDFGLAGAGLRLTA